MFLCQAGTIGFLQDTVSILNLKLPSIWNHLTCCFVSGWYYRVFTRHSEHFIYKVTINPKFSIILLCQTGTMVFLHDTVSIVYINDTTNTEPSYVLLRHVFIVGLLHDTVFYI